MSNVVRLPTAARRQVKQPCNSAGRAARMAFREANPWPGEYMFPTEREALPTAQMLLRMPVTPEMELLTAICATLDDAARVKVAEMLAPGVAVGRDAARIAYAVFRTTHMTVGEKFALDNALRSLKAMEG